MAVDNKTMGRRIAARRKERNMTQKHLADQLSVTDRAVSRWERGVGAPEVSLFPLLASALQISTDELLGSTPPAKETVPVYTPKSVGIPVFYHCLVIAILLAGYVIVLLGVILGNCLHSIPVLISMIVLGLIVMIAACIVSLILYRCPLCGHVLLTFNSRASQYQIQHCRTCGKALYSDKSVRTLKEYRTYKKAR